MKLDNLKLTITKIEDAVDQEDFSYLKCKGYNVYKFLSKNGKKINGFNFFTTIRLYPRSEEQSNETKNRLFQIEMENVARQEQAAANGTEYTPIKPKIKIITDGLELTTPIFAGSLCPILVVEKYDFEKNKMFSKRKQKK